MQHEFYSCYLDSPLIPGRSLDVFEPDRPDWEEHALFLVHGGGWRADSKVKFHPLMEEWSRRGILVASTDYRLADGKSITAIEQLSDIRASYDRFVSFLKRKRRPLKIAVYGESAGAHLAALLALAAPGKCGEKVPEFENPWTVPECVMLQSTPMRFEPWPEIFPGIWGTMQNFAAGVPYAENPALYHRLAPVTYLKPTNPRIFFLEAENEHMFPRRYNQEVMIQHRKWGIRSCLKLYANMEHGFLYALTRARQKEAFEDTIRFMHGEEIA